MPRLKIACIAGWMGIALVLPHAVSAADDTRTKQLRLLCAQLAGDLTEPGGIAEFRRCLSGNPISAIKQNVWGGPRGIALYGAGPRPPLGYGRDSRKAVAGAVTKFQVTGNDLYIRTTDGKLWHETLGTKDGKMLATSVASFQGLGGTDFYAVDDAGTLWRNAGGRRQAVDASVASFQAIGNLVYVRGRDGRLWRETGDMHNRALVYPHVSAFQAIDAATVFVRDDGGNLYRVTTSGRTTIGGSVSDFRVEGGAIYVLSGGVLWLKQGDAPPSQIDSGVVAFQPAAPGSVYTLRGDRALWLVDETRKTRTAVDSDLLQDAGAGAFQATDGGHVYVLAANNALWSEKMPRR